MSFAFDGLLLINKPSGITSHDLVDQVRRAFKTREVGHSGTLDPLASGLMVLLLGKATKLSPYIMDGNKSYQVEVLLGLKTDALDITGKTIQDTAVEKKHWDQLAEQLPLMNGEFQWPVPMHSAVKVGGQKLYELAHQDKKIETPRKIMKFWGAQRKSSENTNCFWVDLNCSKGSFIRTWVDQLGDQLGCGACMKSLIRTASEPFLLSQAQKMSEIENDLKESKIPKAFVGLTHALPQMKKARVQIFDQTLLLNGQISHDLRRLLISLVNPEENSFLQVVSQQSSELLAIVAYEKGSGFKIKRVLASAASSKL